MPPTYDTQGRHGLPALLGSNVISDVDAGFLALRDALDTKIAVADRGPLAAIPASSESTPGIEGRIYRASDIGNGAVFYDTGIGWMPLNAPPVTQLPANPIARMQVRLVADPTGVAGGPYDWLVQYQATGETGPYRWRCRDAQPLAVDVGTAETMQGNSNGANTGYVAGATACQVTVPAPGRYDFEFGATVAGSNGTGEWFVNVMLGTTQPSDNDGIYAKLAAGAGVRIPVARSSRRTIPAGSLTAKLVTHRFGIADPSISGRFLRVRPVLLGPA